MNLDMFHLAVIVEDERVDQILAKRTLEKSGLFKHIQCFDTAEDALDQLAATPATQPDLLLVDIHLPGMSGIEFLVTAQSRLGPAFARCLALMLTNPLLERERQAIGPLIMAPYEFRKPLQSDDLVPIRRDLNR